MMHGIPSPSSLKVCQVQKVSIQHLITRKQSSSMPMTKKNLAYRDLTILNIVQQGSPRGKYHSLPFWGLLGWCVQSLLFASAWKVLLFHPRTVSWEILVHVGISSVSATGTPWAWAESRRHSHYSSECSQTLPCGPSPSILNPVARVVVSESGTNYEAPPWSKGVQFQIEIPRLDISYFYNLPITYDLGCFSRFY